VGTIDDFAEGSAIQDDLRKPFPTEPLPDGLNKSRYLDLDRGMSGTILERHSGIPLVPSRKNEPPAPFAPQRQGRRIDGEDARETQQNLYVGNMSQYRNDETPVPKTQVGPAVGYDGSVPASDGFHPRLRVVPNTALSQRNPTKSVPPTAPHFHVAKPEAAVVINQNAVPRYYEKSHAYITSNPSTGGHNVSAPVPRNNYRESMKDTSRDTEMPGLKNAGGDCVSESTSLFGIGAGPAYAAGEHARTKHSTYDGYENAVGTMRSTDREWSGLWGTGPSTASAPSGHTQRDHWGSTLRAQARDATGLDPERVGQGGPAKATAGTARAQDELQTQGRELIPGLPVINTSPQEMEGEMRSPFKDSVGAQHLRTPQRASYVINQQDPAPTVHVTGPGAQRQRSAFANGRLSKATHREVIDREAFAMPGPHTGIGNAIRQKWQTFALRDATTLAGNMTGPNRPNAFASADFVSGELAPSRELAVPKPEFYNDRMPNMGQRGGMAYVAPTNVQYDPNTFEKVDDRLDVAVDAQRSVDHVYIPERVP